MGQVGHTCKCHKGGLGVTGFQKHHYSSLLKDELIIMDTSQLVLVIQTLQENGLVLEI